MLPPGRYYIGDPCYVIPNDKWDDFLEAKWAAEEQGSSEFVYNGYRCFVHYTSFGDGLYGDEDGFAYPVDSGSIGCVPIELCGDVNDDKLECVRKVTLHNEFEPTYEDGVFYFPCGEIDTNNDPDINDEEDDDDD